jgi:hypothetical protein
VADFGDETITVAQPGMLASEGPRHLISSRWPRVAEVNGVDKVARPAQPAFAHDRRSRR